MAIKGYLTFTKALSLKPHHQMVLCHTQDSRWWRALTLYKDAVGVSYSPSRLGFENMVIDGRLVALNQISLDDSKKPWIIPRFILILTR